MTYELKVLRGISACKKKLAQMQKQCEEYALKTFSLQCSQGTYGQALVLAELAIEKEKLQDYLLAVSRAFSQIPYGYRVLLNDVYIKREKFAQLSKEYNMSPSSLYRKLSKARKCFKNKMESLSEEIIPKCVADVFAEKEPRVRVKHF